MTYQITYNTHLYGLKNGTYTTSLDASSYEDAKSQAEALRTRFMASHLQLYFELTNIKEE